MTFLSQVFWNSATSLDDESYSELEKQTIEMLRSLNLFLTYEILDDDFDEYDCQSPVPYEHLVRKTEDQTELEVRKEWVDELLKYEQYVRDFSSIRASNSQNKAESFDVPSPPGRRHFGLQAFVGLMM